MEKFFQRALLNISQFGDTDIFPFPFENHVLFDKPAESIQLLLDLYKNFEERLAQYPPSNISALAPVSYTGFRWATQLDPLWNAFFFGVVLSIGDKIESRRIPKDQETVFSYRFNNDVTSADLFDQASSWRTFMEKSLSVAKDKKFVVTCDISEFYPRLNHHRLENALRQLRLRGDQPTKIMKFLENFSDSYSFGLPIGGPAARILSEFVIKSD